MDVVCQSGCCLTDQTELWDLCDQARGDKSFDPLLVQVLRIGEVEFLGIGLEAILKVIQEGCEDLLNQNYVFFARIEVNTSILVLPIELCGAKLLLFVHLFLNFIFLIWILDALEIEQTH